MKTLHNAEFKSNNSFMLIALLASAMILTSACKKDKDTSDQQDNSSSREYVAKRESNKFTEITDKFGFPIIKEGQFSSEADKKPWSSWWYPRNREDLFHLEGTQLSPLQKYDKYIVKITNQRSEAARYEEKNLFDPQEVAWAGLCHAWSVASILEDEPRLNKWKGGVNFSAADQKALLLKSYENVKGLEYYGERFNGYADDVYSDIYPEQFHRFVQLHLFEKKKAFMMDYDASFPVWTVPVYKANITTKRISNTVVEVITFLTYTSPFVDKNFIGNKKINKIYKYRLYGNWSGDHFEAVNGEWLEESIHDHPDYLIAYPENAIKETSNKELDLKAIEEILR